MRLWVCAVRLLVGTVLAAASIAQATPVPALDPSQAVPRLGIHQCSVTGAPEPLLCGTLLVAENRAHPSRRKLPIAIAVIPARNKASGEGPIFIFGGGPGQTATELAKSFVGAWQREDHDIVFVDHRGTGLGHRLDCARGVSDDNPQVYLQQVVTRDMARRCRRLLEGKFDLTQYSTAAAVLDLEDARKALGYPQINIQTSSYGSYLALVYMRDFPGRVRSAVLGSVVRIDDRPPLHLAQTVQQALDATLRECEAEPACQAAFPTVRDDFYKLWRGLQRAPATALVTGISSPDKVRVTLTAEAFAESIRLLLYSAAGGRKLPFLIDRATHGDFSTFADVTLQSNRRLLDTVRSGLFLAVTCSEAVARINPSEIAAVTNDTFLGAARIKAQMAACAEWPRTQLPANFFRSFTSPVPTLLLNYSLDPAVPPWAAEMAKSSLPNSIVVMTAGGHSGSNECTGRIARQLFKSASVQGLDLSCVPTVRLPPFQLRAASDGRAGN